ncbi:MAG: glycosyltransferase WbuB, partial [Oscillospiraceae bacterium]|nr:glycosyltransferase WbuB [Oscillospiraceae bacterium]
PQSIVSKIGDYLAAKKPMINTCVDAEFWQKVETDGFGLNVEPDNAELLAERILFLKNHPEESERMSEIARKIAEEQFDRKKSYMKIVRLIDSLINN